MALLLPHTFAFHMFSWVLLITKALKEEAGVWLISHIDPLPLWA